MANLINIIIEPGKVFSHIKENDDWWIPFILVVVVSYVATWFTTPVLARLATQRMAEMGVGRELPAAFGLFQYIAIPVSVLIVWFSVSFIFWILSNAFGGDWDYIKALNLFAYSSVIGVIKSIIKLSVLLIRGRASLVTLKDLRVATGLDLFFQPESQKLYAFVSGINLFEIWIYTLVAFGISDLAGVSRRKGAIVSIITFFVALGIKALLTREAQF